MTKDDVALAAVLLGLTGLVLLVGILTWHLWLPIALAVFIIVQLSKHGWP